MEYKMAYGQGYKSLGLPEQNVAAVINPKFPRAADPGALVEAALHNPIASPALDQLIKVKRPGRVAVIVNDHTRPTPHDYMLPILLRELNHAGISNDAITLVVATGAHRGNTAAESQISLGTAASRCAIVNHNCRSTDLIDMGVLSNGVHLHINPLVAEAELVILTGMIAPHELAGFSGGRKSILPGIAGIEAITANHSLLTRGGIGTGKLDGNPVHRLMMEAMQVVKPDFILNVVADTQNLPVHAVAGDPEKAWLAGTKLCRDSTKVRNIITADIAFTSAGGYPRDINLYQTIKPMRSVAKFIKEGGTLVMFARCNEGAGNAVLEQWVHEAASPFELTSRLQKQFVLGGHKAHLLAELVGKVNVVLVSDMLAQSVRQFFMESAQSPEEALQLVTKKHGSDFKAVVIPWAGLIITENKYAW
ncbi:Nickel-dependent lactate racemase [Desulfotomaculum arcticum]|uniref:Nickel-dependent lactate racemase n=1 Tax=Desulfotruncus arcticus DSM 17038 TaxID=1121424 RepID=A0A1I2QFV5_9FIRM|nr:nickel-dependent lactate racemase [Desulfotruncus arcticus]SFG27244.1 Nickel-dependent lactate racemase [Desulfotomaculum arcticum] [Desulfotruncus arcticus DSM 17038]